MKISNLRPSCISDIDQLKTLLSSASRNLMEAGKLTVSIINKGVSQEELIERSGLPKTLISSLVKIGENRMLPELLMETSLWAYRLRDAPITIQQQVISKGVDFVNPDTLETVKVDPKTLTYKEVIQVFDGNNLRTPIDQKKYLNSRPAKFNQFKGDIVNKDNFQKALMGISFTMTHREMQVAVAIWEHAFKK